MADIYFIRCIFHQSIIFFFTQKLFQFFFPLCDFLLSDFRKNVRIAKKLGELVQKWKLLPTFSQKLFEIKKYILNKINTFHEIANQIHITLNNWNCIFLLVKSNPMSNICGAHTVKNLVYVVSPQSGQQRVPNPNRN